MWAFEIGTPFANGDEASDIQVEDDGTIYIIGEQSNTNVDYDPGPGLAEESSTGPFFAKYSSDGDFIWVKHLVGSQHHLSKMSFDGLGNILIYGVGAYSDLDWGPGNVNLNSWPGLYVAKYDTSGTYISHFELEDMNTGSFNQTSDLCVDSSQNIIITGFFENTTSDFDPGPGTTNLTAVGGMGQEIFIAKYDQNYNLLWAHKIGGDGDDIGFGLSVDPGGNVRLTGYYGAGGGNTDVDFDPGPGISMLTDDFGTELFVLGLDANGNFSDVFKAEVTEAVGSNRGRCLLYDNTGSSFYLGCDISAHSDFDPGPGVTEVQATSTGFYMVLAKYSGCSSAPIQPGTITGTTAPCNGASETYGITPVSGASSYTWTLPSGWTGTSTTNSINVTAGASGGTIEVTANNACGSSTAQTLAVSIDPVPSQPSTISGSSTICSGGSDTYAVTNDPSATSYTWTLPGGWSGTSSTNSINATAGASGGTIEVTADNACGSSTPQTITVSVEDVPSQPSTITGNMTLCEGDTETYSVINDPSATDYSWTLPGGWSGSSTTNSINGTSGTSGGTIQVTADNACGSSTTQTTSIVVNPAPTVMATGATNICDGETTTISASGATSYVWDNSLGAGASHDVSPSTTTTYTVIGTDGNGCEGTDQITITINPQPDVTVSLSGITLSSNNSNAGVTYQWIDCDNNNITITGETNQDYTPTSNGNYAVIITENGCTDTSLCYTVDGVGVDEYFASQIEIYPNPTGDFFNVLIHATDGNYSISLFNSLGQRIITNQVEGEITKFDISELPAGIYIVEVRSEVNIHEIKVVKN